MGQLFFIVYTLSAPFLTAPYVIFVFFSPRRARIITGIKKEYAERLATKIPEIPDRPVWVHAASMLIGRIPVTSVDRLTLDTVICELPPFSTPVGKEDSPVPP